MYRSLVFLTIASCAFSQQPEQPPSQTITITLQNALARARKYGAQVETADIAARFAHEDVKQAKATTLPTLNGLNQFIYTEGNGTPSGVFVANDGVHVYNEQLQGHADLLAFIRRGPVHLAEAAEAVARAKADLAARGLNATVIQDYYTIANTERRIANAQQSLKEAKQFQDITEKLEQGGEAAHADVLKAQLQVQQRQRDLGDALLALQKAKIALAVLIFPAFQLDYDIVDDLAELPVPPTLPDAVAQATSNSPDLRAANANVSQAKLGVTVARYAYLPSFGLDVFYGINANQFAAVSSQAQATGRSTLPNYQVTNRQNLGYSAMATLNIPLWDWGSIRSKVRQASLKERQAELDLNITQKQFEGEIASSWQEAQTAFSQVSSLRDSAGTAAESLRLTLLRYQAGEATALEVTDAQTTASQARNAYADGLLRYRTALATLGSLTGIF
ncbi:MAG: TolC family protein [Acidobacteriaceae bacterium]|nr:TolC family protein [Acidobacteriaceae bacterium]